MTDYISVREAAELAGLTPDTLTAAIRRGTLRAIKPSRDWLVTRADLDAYLTARPAVYQGPNPPRPRRTNTKEQQP